jgi:hypothetical protein
MHTTHLRGPQGVLNEPTNVAPNFPTVQLGDVVLRLYEHKILLAYAINFSMVATPQGAINAQEQRINQIRMHTVRKLEKWKRLFSPRAHPKTDTDPKNDEDAEPEPELDLVVRKHHVIQYLHNDGISMIPATIGPFRDFGPMLEMLLLYGTFPSDVNYMAQLAKHQKGKQHTRDIHIMCASSITSKSESAPTYGRRGMEASCWVTLVWTNLPEHVLANWPNKFPSVLLGQLPNSFHMTHLLS